MKFLKVFSIVALSAMALAANAESPQVKITIKGQNNTYAAELNLVQDAQYAEYNSKFESDALNAEAIDLYAVYGGKNYSTLFAADINGIKIGFKGNSNTNYTMTFTGVAGTVKLYDAVEDSVIVVVNDGTYKFTATAKTAITDRFQIGKPATTYTRDQLTVGDWGTICLPKASSAIVGATMYEVVGYDAEKGVALLEFAAAQQMVAGTPYVFKATATELSVTLTGEAATAPATVKNGFVGSFDGCAVDDGNYIIYNNALYKAAGSCSIAANRAYFDLTNMEPFGGNAPGRKLIFMGGKGISTGVEAAEAAPAMDGKVMMNGKLVIIRDGKMFNAQGAAL